jgi:hypothetical protein
MLFLLVIGSPRNGTDRGSTDFVEPCFCSHASRQGWTGIPPILAFTPSGQLSAASAVHDASKSLT